MKKIVVLMTVLLFAVPDKNYANHLHGSQVSFGASITFGHAGYFYDTLRPYGDWIEIERGFYGWRPNRVHRGWRPYMNGRWAWTDYGWYWVSYEPFGWAVFHYGRWYFDDYYGWIWIPDNVWGPSWVEWRYDNDYIGWAPLPPYARFSVLIGIRFTTRWNAPSHYWNFISHRNFNNHSVSRYIVNENHTRRLIRTTRSAGAYEVDRDRIINRGVDRNIIERNGNVRIDRIDVRETGERGERIVRDGRSERIEVFRPTPNDFDRAPERIEARRPERRLSIDMESIEYTPREETTSRESNRRSGSIRIEGEKNLEERKQLPPQRQQEEMRRMPEGERSESRSKEIWRVRPEAQRDQPRTVPDQSQERRRQEPQQAKPDNQRNESKEKEKSRRGGSRRDQ